MSGTNYIRQSTFTDGDIITAALFNNEYNQIQNAFVYAATGTTGHRHDGTSGQGGNIHTIGDQDFDNKIAVDSTNNRWGFFVSVGDVPVEQIRIQDGAIVPVTDDDIDLGTSSLEFKDLYIDGTAYLDAISFNGTVISATASELNTLDGITSTVAELNVLDGITATTAELNYTDGVTSSIQTQIDTKAPTASPTFTGTLTAPTINASTSLEIAGTALTVTAAELNTLDGITATVAELNALDGITATVEELNILDGVTATTAELNILDGVTATTAELNALDGITATVSELNILDGVTATTAELNTLDGITATVAELNALDGITATVAELNILDGVTATTAELNALDGITATVTELNLLDGVTATTAEINFLDGVTSSIQSQLSGLQGSDQSLVDISGITHSDGLFIVSNGTNWVGESGNTAITSLGVTATATELNLLDGATVTTAEINYLDGVTSNIQTQINALQTGDTDLAAIAALTPTDSVFIVGNGSTWVAETGATARASLGLTIGTDVLAYDSNLQSFVTTFTIPTTDGTSGQALLTDGAGSISFGDVDALPTQTGNNGYYLTTNGSVASWAAVNIPSFVYTRANFTATASQTNFTVSYTVGYVDVYLNGVKLIVGTDVTATNGTSIVLASGATAGDLIEVVAFETFEVANALTSSNLGVTVQAYDIDTAKYDATTANFTGTLQNGGSNVLVDTDIGSTVQAYDATIVVDADIGVTVQGYDANTTTSTNTQTLTNKTIRDTVYALSGVAFDATNGAVQTKTLAANTTFTDSLSSGDAIVLQLEAGASYTVTWPTMTWVTSGGNVAPTLTAKDTLVFWKVSSTLYGAYTGSYV